MATWSAPRGIVAGTTVRFGPGRSEPPFYRLNLGLNSGDDPDTVRTNRLSLRRSLALPQSPRWLRQVHGRTVVRFGPEVDDAEPEADAAVAAAGDAVLAVLTADCLPVLFCSMDGQELGAAHAGWRGLAAGVLEATVAAMACPATQLLAWLGPAAGPQAYEVGEEVRAAFVDANPAAADAFVPTRPGHWHMDLYALARQRLAALGVSRISGGDHCTISEPKYFYSHRRDVRTGRMASLIWRQPERLGKS